MKITTEQIKQLRDTTGVSVMQCKRALEEAGGDMDQAIILLRKKSSDIASKKEGRELNAGVVAAYIHAGGNVGSMVELACETDFVAKNEEFKRLAYDIAMHVAASNPEFLSTGDITEEDKGKVRAAFAKEVAESDKPEDIKEKMLQGKIDTYFKEKALLEQNFIKDPSVTIKNLEEQAVQKFGEKTKVVRFVRFAV
ncbi:MAG: elongation factor Ts [Candidatus Yonathbacteria bacterium]|nr:elongation factor Ts [Candidatus Yonathbacteria bacterium]